jgi:hypothetical protein
MSCGLPAAAPDHEVAIGHAGVELELRASQSFLQPRHDPPRVVGRYVAGREVAHHPVVDRHQVAAPGGVVGAQIDADVRRLERRAAGVDRRRVVPQHREVGDVAAGRHARRHRLHEAHRAGGRQSVHARRHGGLEGRAATEFVERLVGHAVGDQEDVLQHGPGDERHARALTGSRRPPDG